MSHLGVNSRDILCERGAVAQCFVRLNSMISSLTAVVT